MIIYLAAGNLEQATQLWADLYSVQNTVQSEQWHEKSIVVVARWPRNNKSGGIIFLSGYKIGQTEDDL